MISMIVRGIQLKFQEALADILLLTGFLLLLK